MEPETKEVPMPRRFHAQPIPTATDIRRKYAETRSVPLTAARCGVPVDYVRDALIVLA
jgi:hypothetical protein